MQNDNEKFKKDFAQRLIKFSLNTILLCRDLKKDPILWAIADQLIRSAISIGANVVEAKSSSSRRDYIKYFEIALKSANEAKYWLILAKEASNNLNNQIQALFQETSEIANIIASSTLTLKGKK